MLSKKFFSFCCLVISLAFIFSVLPTEEFAAAQTSGGDCPPFDSKLANQPGRLNSLPEKCQAKYKALHTQKTQPKASVQAISPGPDDYGYTSDDTISYSWISASTPSGLTGDDASSAGIPIGFNFPFYENSYFQLWISTNGKITFDNNGTFYDLPDRNIPNPRFPDLFIAPFWEDLVVGPPYNLGGIYYSLGGTSPNRYFVVEWRDVTYYWGSSAFSFEVILYENGNIIIQHQSVPSESYYATVGIENYGGTDGLQYFGFDGGFSAPNAILFTYPGTPTARVKATPKLQGQFVPLTGTATFRFYVTNTGTLGTDTYDFFPPGPTSWSITLYADGGLTPLTDTDLDGTIDTGAIIHNETKAIVAKFSPPVDAVVGDYLNCGLTIKSSINPSKTGVVTFQLSIPTGFAGVYEDDGHNEMNFMIASPEGSSSYTAYNTRRYRPAVARSPGGTYLYAWVFDPSSYSNIQYSLMGSDGSVVRGPTHLTNNSGQYIWDYMPAVAVAPNGMMGIVYPHEQVNENGQYKIDIYLALLDSSGNLAYGPVSVTNNAWGYWDDSNFIDVYSPSITATSDNHFALSWVRETYPGTSVYYDNIWYAVYSSSGGLVKAPAAFTSNNQSYGCALNSLPNGRAILTIQDESTGTGNVHYAIINSNGIVVKGNTQVGTDYSDVPDAVALPDGKIAIGWTPYYGNGVSFVILDSSFNVVAGPTYSAFEPSAFSPYSYALSMTTDYLSRVVFTWSGADGFAQMYALGDSAGTYITPPLASLTGSSYNVSLNSQGSAPWPTDFMTSWYGGAVVTADQNVVAVGRPHIGSEVASYGGFSSGSTTQFVPMLFKQMWGSYDSALYIQNSDTANLANVTIKFYDPDGVLNCTKTDSIPAMSSHGYWLPSETCLPANWYGGVVIIADRDIVAVGRPHIGSQVMTYNGFASGSLTMYVPMLFKQMWGYDSAFYVQNTDDTNEANITIKFYDPDGNLNCTKTDIIPKLSSHGYWLPSESCLPDSWYGGVVVTSDRNIVAVGRPHLGSEVTTYNGFAAGSTTMYAPMLFKGAYGSYDSALYIQNVDATNTATIAIKFYDSSGTLSCTKDDTIEPGSSKGYWLPSETCLSAGWVGSVKVESDQPVVGIARPHLGSSITAYDGFTSGGTSASVPMLFKQMWDSYDSALYLENTDPSNTANVTTAFYDVNGNLSCIKTDTIGPLATLSYWLPSLTCSP